MWLWSSVCFLKLWHYLMSFREWFLTCSNTYHSWGFLLLPGFSLCFTYAEDIALFQNISIWGVGLLLDACLQFIVFLVTGSMMWSIVSPAVFPSVTFLFLWTCKETLNFLSNYQKSKGRFSKSVFLYAVRFWERFRPCWWTKVCLMCSWMTQSTVNFIWKRDLRGSSLKLLLSILSSSIFSWYVSLWATHTDDMKYISEIYLSHIWVSLLLLFELRKQHPICLEHVFLVTQPYMSSFSLNWVRCCCNIFNLVLGAVVWRLGVNLLHSQG